MERKLSFTGSTTRVTHIIEMEAAHLERLQQQKPSHKPTLWKRLFTRTTGISNRTVHTASLSQSSSSRSVHNSRSFVEDFASTADDTDDNENSRQIQLDDSYDGAVELIHSHSAPKSDLDRCVPAHYNCCMSPCGSLEEVYNMVQFPSFSNDILEEEADDKTGIDPANFVDDELNHGSLKEMVREAQYFMSTGEHEHALELYRDVLKAQEQTLPVCPFEMANVCYACSRCAYLLRDYDLAFTYALRELYYTKQCGNGVPTLAVATSYHELARLCKVGLGDLTQTLRYYRAAVSTSQSCLERLRHDKQSQCVQCQQICSSSSSNTNSTTTTTTLCQIHRADQEEIMAQIKESKQCMGRIYFETGNFDAAMRMI